MKIYHAANARSCRARWLLEELGLAYETVELPFTDRRTPEYLAKNPNGALPTLEDGDVVLFESGAICEYLLERYGAGRLQPSTEAPERPAYLQWFHWAEATAMPPIADLVQHSFLRPEERRIAAIVPDAIERIQRCLAIIESTLATRPYIVGDTFTAADIMLGYTVYLTQLLGQLGEGHPTVSAYLARLAERPGYQAAFAA
jgi:glutathione S-transferase